MKTTVIVAISKLISPFYQSFNRYQPHTTKLCYFMGLTFFLLYAGTYDDGNPISSTTLPRSNAPLLPVSVTDLNGCTYNILVHPTDNARQLPWGKNINHGAQHEYDGDVNTPNIVVESGGYNASQYAAKVCYDLVCQGYSDWYLPSKMELRAIHDQLVKQAHANSQPPIGDFSGAYWSSTENSPQNRTTAWTQNFNHVDIVVENLHHKYAVLDNCRCVRKVDCANSGNEGLPRQNITLANGDSYTLRIFNENNGSPATWNEAVQRCQDLVAFGCDQWYLPSVEELMAINAHLAPGNYWSSTQTNPARAQTVDNNGTSTSSKKTDLNNCRCVRKNGPPF